MYLSIEMIHISWYWLKCWLAAIVSKIMLFSKWPYNRSSKLKKFKSWNFHISDSSLYKNLYTDLSISVHDVPTHIKGYTTDLLIWWASFSEFLIFLTGPEGWIWARGDSCASVRAMIVGWGGGLGNWLLFCSDTCQQPSSSVYMETEISWVSSVRPPIPCSSSQVWADNMWLRGHGLLHAEKST